MDWEFLTDFWNSQTPLGITVGTIVSILAVAVGAFVIERVITRYLRRFSKRARLEPNATNSLVLTFRILVLIGALVILIRVGGLTSEWLVTFSALGGAAVGFASSKTIGNFIAGLYLLASRPFKVGDYVRIGTIEGIVQEITINYTKILTMGNNMVSIINLQIMDRDITNYQYENDDGEGLYCYTFEIGLDHSVSAPRMAKIFDEVFDKCCSKLPHKPHYVIVRSGGFDRVYMVYLYVKDPKAIFQLRSRIVEDVFDRWDRERAKTAS